MAPATPRSKPAASDGLVVGIPAFNEEIAIASVVVMARQYADQVVVVDDGSSDRTAKVAELAGARVLRHEQNKGYGGALRTLFEVAKAEQWPSLAIIDADGQHDAEDIGRVATPVRSGQADIAIGSRFIETQGQENIPGYRKLGIKVLTTMSNAGASEAQRTTDGQSGFRVYSRKAIEALDLADSNMGVSSEILFEARRKDLRIADVAIVVRYDVDGSSQHPVSHGLGVMGSILRYAESRHPLSIWGLPGLLFLAMGIAAMARLAVDGKVWLAAGIASLTLGLLGCLVAVVLHAVVHVARAKRN